MIKLNHFIILYLTLILLSTKSGEKMGDYKLTGGHETNWENYKFMAYTYFFINATRLFTIAGNLVSPKWVLTVAHWLPEDKLPMYIAVGHAEVNLENPYLIDLRIKHPKFSDKPCYFYDVALLRIKNAIAPSDKIGFVKFSKNKVPPGSNCKVAGWGTPKNVMVLPKTGLKLHEVDVKITTKQECMPLLRESCTKHIDRYIFIRMISSAPYIGQTIGDPGAPVICNGELVAIDSMTLSATHCDWTSSITPLLPWINETMIKYATVKAENLTSRNLKSGATSNFNFIINSIFGCIIK